MSETVVARDPLAPDPTIHKSMSPVEVAIDIWCYRFIVHHNEPECHPDDDHLIAMLFAYPTEDSRDAIVDMIHDYCCMEWAVGHMPHERVAWHYMREHIGHQVRFMQMWEVFRAQVADSNRQIRTLIDD